MSIFRVTVEIITKVEHHPNADRLDIVTVLGWQCVVSRDKFSVGDPCVYFPIDSVLPDALVQILFPPESKIKLSKNRIKTIKLRGVISQGLVVRMSAVGVMGAVGDDCTSFLGVVKYEPPVENLPGQSGSSRPDEYCNPHFKEYTDIENWKNYPTLFQEGEEIIVTEKLHGTNFRAGYVPFHAGTLWKKIKKFFGFTPDWEFVYGSHHKQLQGRPHASVFDDTNVYAEIVEKYSLKSIIPFGWVIYGEIVGSGIQRGYGYGEKRHTLFAFDIKINCQFIQYHAVEWLFCSIPRVPILYVGPYTVSKLDELASGPSKLDPSVEREGVVVRSFNRSKILKRINDNYLLMRTDVQDEETFYTH